MQKLLFIAIGLLFVANVASANTSQARPLTSVAANSFLQMQQDAQKLYVAGVMDGFTYVTYGHHIANHDAVVKCLQSKDINNLTHDVVDWLKQHPAFNEGLSSAVVQAMSSFCA
ncbi:hypothetical protein [Sulfurirhabdus autotrophica]|uniref:Rap1a immunity protein domain-containing protein n=1 Tax=Sulfurirhabdus autotrophica TaxID=1706046 RepID=A0A4R3Y4M9_9PROT|nr:hypothetical protein [Sulfurirhabdus autotrophica]TCV86726.1 hypothetical protein EDC63_10687 [Sulfurirhabdus autotrophica]